MSIDWGRPVMTRDGRKVRVLCRDRKGEQNVATLIDMGDYESWQFYDSIGKCGNLSLDLINVPQKRWVNLYRDVSGWPKVGGAFYESHSEALSAINARVGKLVATVEVTLPASESSHD